MRRATLVRAFSSLRAAAGLAVVAGALPGCEVADPEAGELRFAPEAETEIFGGTADTTHDAVVYLEGNGACTGTIIGASNGTGWPFRSR